ncbi:MAG: hypothetical protein AAFY08_14445 [Planctomycetota bacterium]
MQAARDRLLALREERDLAQRSFGKAIKAAFPVGCEVTSIRGNGRARVIVLGHGWDGRLGVRNPLTEAEYTVCITQIAESPLSTRRAQ